jgi:hypothetical protein
MAAIGNSPTQQAFTPAIDYFSGNGSTTAFTLSRPVASVAQVQVTIDNVAQNPSSAYTVSSNTITFTSAPLSGTNNIYVYYTSPITQVIAPGQGTVNTTALGNITNIASGNSSLTLQTGSGNTTAVTVDTSQNVGIGTASPSVKLDVSGSVRFGATSSNRILYLGQSSPADNGAGSLEFQVSNTVKNWAIRTNNNVAGALEFCPSTAAGGTTYTTPSMVIDSSGNVNIGSSTTPNTGSLSNRFLQLVANGYGSVGTAASNGVLTFTCNISANTATTFLYCADIDKWGGTILISYVRDADQNRSGMKMVRYAYNRTYTTLLDSSQNSGATFSVSANNLQVTIGGAGTYLTQFTIWGSAGP